jgi:catecholate siderophore receptor
LFKTGALCAPTPPPPTARFNINNLTNRFYWSRIGASLDGFQLYGVPGAGRTYTAGLDLSF